MKIKNVNSSPSAFAAICLCTFAVFFYASCKKDRSCHCTTETAVIVRSNPSIVSTSTTTEVTDYKRISEREGKTLCKSKKVVTELSTSTKIDETDCELK